jgi:hypothetical protein
VPSISFVSPGDRIDVVSLLYADAGEPLNARIQQRVDALDKDFDKDNKDKDDDDRKQVDDKDPNKDAKDFGGKDGDKDGKDSGKEDKDEQKEGKEDAKEDDKDGDSAYAMGAQPAAAVVAGRLRNPPAPVM